MNLQRLTLILLALSLFTGPLSAQYFGQNKVYYETIDFEVFQTPNFDIYNYLENEDALVTYGNWAEHWYRAHLAVFRDNALKEKYNPVLGDKEEELIGRQLISKDNSGEINIAPVVSPDGSELYFSTDELSMKQGRTHGEGKFNLAIYDIASGSTRHLNFFVDGGMSWFDYDQFKGDVTVADSEGVERVRYSKVKPIFSVGTSVGVNLFGAIILEP
jgi:hypothetical protein